MQKKKHLYFINIYNDLGDFSHTNHTHGWTEITNRPKIYSITYTTIDPGDEVVTSEPEGTLICVYLEEGAK